MVSLDSILRGEGSSLIPQQHLTQVGMFLWKRGIELFLIDDCVNNPERDAFLKDLFYHLKIPLYLNDIWQKGARSGEVLLYLRPFGNGYNFLYYGANQFDPFYDDDGNLDRVVIRSSRRGGVKDLPVEVVTELSKVRIEVWEGRSTDDQPTLSMTNPYGFVPAVVVQNRPVVGGRGLSEFAGFEGMIEQHDWQLEQVHGNVEFFGGPIFYSSRSQTEMLEAGLVNSYRSVAEEGGYGYRRSEERIKARKIISGLEEGEQIGFTTPSPIDSNVFSFIQGYAAEIISAMGGVSVSASTFVTSSSLSQTFSTPIVTASQRAYSYITYGLCSLFQLGLEMAVQDGFIPPDAPSRVFWRYTGDIFPDTPQQQLTKSIVSRNLIRLGVNLTRAIQHIFPEKTEDEIQALLDGGFAYELLNGVSQVGGKFPTEDDELIAKLKEIILREVSNV